eukprot:m.68080 g.68080  ORF g.68080 m.68080 type:complete len:234 (+) comp11938_c0_seq1:130-831(+)
MGCANGKHKKEFYALSNDDVKRLSKWLPVFGVPHKDIEGNNHLVTVYIARFTNGYELTVKYKDEDNPVRCLDCLHDCVRRPLFGRGADIETFFIIHEGEQDDVSKTNIVFPNVYSGDRNWGRLTGTHLTNTLSYDAFDGKDSNMGKHPIVWVNTWNHAMGEVNNNEDAPIDYYAPAACDAPATSDEMLLSYNVLEATRDEVDNKYVGFMDTIGWRGSSVKAALGDRIPLYQSL